jgi:hypothetical protein
MLFRSVVTAMASLSAVTLASAPASAADYVFDVAAKVADLQCFSNGSDRNCFVLFAVTPPSDNVGDNYFVNATFDGPVFVPKSSGFGYAYTTFNDQFVTPFDINGTNNVRSSLVMTDFSGQGAPNSGPYLLLNRSNYVAIGGYDAVNPGFSFTGFNASIHLLSHNPNSLVALSVGYFVRGVPEPATWALMLMGFGGMGVALRRRRSQVALGT